VTSALIVCTRNRLVEVNGLLGQIADQIEAPSYVVVADSSDTKWDKSQFEYWSNRIVGLRYLAVRHGLPYQRNVAIKYLEDLDVAFSFISFLDDDVSIPQNYIQEVGKFFLSFPEFSGVGAWDSTLQLRQSLARKILQLGDSSASGIITKSGIAVPPWNVVKLRSVEWFPGFGMSFRWRPLKNFRFDGRYRMYGEDVEAQIRLDGILAVSPNIRLAHLGAPTGRASQAMIQYHNNAFRYRLSKTENANVSLRWVLASTTFLLLGELGMAIVRLDTQAFNRACGHGKFFFDLFVGKLKDDQVLHNYSDLTPDFIFS